MYGSGLAYKRKMSRDDFVAVVNASEISYMRKGTYGAILKCIIPGESPYVDSWNGERINTILLKVGLVCDTNKRSVQIRTIKETGLTITPTRRADFMSEVAIQEELYAKTERNPICPSIIDSFELTLREYEAWDIKSLQFVTDRADLMVSIIGMEMVADPVMICTEGDLSGQDFNEQAAMGRAKLLEMGALGYAHGDFHRGNVLFSRSDGRVYLIDFGMTKRFKRETHDAFTGALAAKNYTRALRLAMMEAKYSNTINFEVQLNNFEKFTELRNSDWDTTPRNAELLREINDDTGNNVFEFYRTHYGWLFAESGEGWVYNGPQLLELSAEQITMLEEQMERSERIGPPTGFMGKVLPEIDMRAATAARSPGPAARSPGPATRIATPRTATPPRMAEVESAEFAYAETPAQSEPVDHLVRPSKKRRTRGGTRRKRRTRRQRRFVFLRFPPTK